MSSTPAPVRDRNDQLNANVSKNFALVREMVFQMRIDAFNVFNHLQTFASATIPLRRMGPSVWSGSVLRGMEAKPTGNPDFWPSDLVDSIAMQLLD